MKVRVRFLGGPNDGNVWTVSESLVKGLGIIRYPFRQGLWGALEVHVYQWDLTVNEGGERRMRWKGAEPGVQ